MEIIIEKDLFDIANRINKISKNYCLVFDTTSCKYFVCNKNINSIEFSLPYNCLDKRSIDYVLQMKSKNNFEILEDIEKHNQKVFDKNKDIIKQNAIQSAEKILRRS